MTIYFIGDTHFGHKNILTFTREDGSPLRDFSSIEEMDEYLVDKWNSVVRDEDTVYHMGDVVMNRKNLHIVHRLKGKKNLVRGNHDTAPTKELMQYFEEIYGTHNFKDMILSHVPIAKECLDRFGVNVHGHLHSKSMNDPKYFNVSAEQIDYTPISLEQLRAKIAEAQK